MNRSSPRRNFIILIALATLLVVFYAPEFRANDNKAVLHVGLPRSMPPFAFVDERFGNYRGFCIDLAAMAGRLMKTEIKFHSYDNKELLEALINRKIDIACCTLMASEADFPIKLIPTGIKVDGNLFVNKTCVTVTCLKDLPGHPLVVEKERQQEVRALVSPEVKILEAASSETALEILNEGSGQVYISSNTPTTLYLIQKNGFQNIKMTGMPIETVNLSFAVLKDRLDLLTSLSTAIGKIEGSPQFQQIRNKWLGSGIEVNVWRQYIKYVLGALACLLIGILVFAGWNFALKRRVQQMTKELTYSEQRYRELIESSNEMIQIISLDGTLRMTNRISLELLAPNRTEMTGQNLIDLVVPEQKKAMQEFIRSLFERGHGEEEFIFLATDGTKIPIEMIATTISDDVGHLNGLASCFSRDIRVRKRLEEELIRADRLAILGQISASFAHEINNPLGIVLANAQDLLNQPTDDQDHQQVIQTIIKNTERAASTVNDLLTFTRQGPLVEIPLNLADVIAESLIFVHAKIKARKIIIRKEIPSSGAMVCGDERQLMQLMVNLLLNSIQVLSSNGYIVIRVKKQTALSGEEILLEVEDNGPGINPSDLKKIFDPFYTTKETGFGLGLFISRTIVERHRGIIWAESGQEGGTTMHVTLPALSAESDRGIGGN